MVSGPDYDYEERGNQLRQVNSAVWSRQYDANNSMPFSFQFSALV